MMWHAPVLSLLRESGLFREVRMEGAKVRATLGDNRFLDIHFDPESRSYSYAFIDLSLSHAGDKRLFGWDDFPHIGDAALAGLSDYPHHFQRRGSDGRWQFSPSEFRGEIDAEIVKVIEFVRRFLANEAKGATDNA